jgi:hypothetical protein
MVTAKIIPVPVPIGPIKSAKMQSAPIVNPPREAEVFI